MGASVGKLDKSGWGVAAERRQAQFDGWRKAAAHRAIWEQSEAGEAYRAAFEAHPLYGALDGVSEEALDRSKAPRYRLKVRDFKNGHAEAVVTTEYPDPQKTLERVIKRDLRALAWKNPYGRDENIQRAVRRAKQEVRLKCKAMAVNSLWTLTFRQNVVDREVALKCLDAFRRRVVKVLGDWRYIAALEKQDRGAWHIHLATHALPAYIKQGGVKVKSWDVMRAIWRSCAGDRGGNFDEAKRGKRWSGRDKAIRGVGAIARYIAGYVAKEMQESDLGRKRYSGSKDIDVPAAYTAIFECSEAPMTELLVLAFAGVGDQVCSRWFDRKRGVFFMETDDSSVGRLPWH